MPIRKKGELLYVPQVIQLLQHQTLYTVTPPTLHLSTLYSNSLNSSLVVQPFSLYQPQNMHTLYGQKYVDSTPHRPQCSSNFQQQFVFVSFLFQRDSANVHKASSVNKCFS